MPWNSAELERLTRDVEAALEETHVPGAAIALIAPDTVWTFGVGRAGEARPVTPSTLFRANSVTKSMVALAALRLAERGQLVLDQPLREALPDVVFSNPWEDTHPVRVVHLLEHTTGFDDLRPREYGFYPEDGDLSAALALNPATRTARWAPGTRMAYNNGGYAVAAAVLERATGLSFAELVEQDVLGPLGMEASGIDVQMVEQDVVSQHVLPSGQEEPLTPYPLLIHPAGGLLTSAADLARFVQVLLTGATPADSVYLGAASLERMRTPSTSEAAQAGLHLGYGLGSYTAIAEGRLWHGHAGGTPSAYARYALQPELGVGYVLLMNGADANVRRRIEQALQHILADGHPAPMVPDAVSLSNPESYAGVYRQSTSNWQLTAGLERLFDVQRVHVEGERLVLAPVLGDLPDTLVTAGGALFRSTDFATPTAVFLSDDNGTITGLRTWDAENLRAGNYERVSPFRAYAPLVVLPLALVLMVSALLVGLVRALVSLFRRQASPGRWVRWLPFLAVAAWIASVLTLVVGLSGNGDIAEVLGQPSKTAVGFWVFTWLFAALSIGALGVTLHALIRKPELGRFARGYAFAVALACVVWVSTLVSWGLLGLRTWIF
ncbi:MAG: hypothetical protein RhofKO_13370 [Rhodothermales bacterium]